jgi:hypothetical protein
VLRNDASLVLFEQILVVQQKLMLQSSDSSIRYYNDLSFSSASGCFMQDIGIDGLTKSSQPDTQTQENNESRFRTFPLDCPRHGVEFCSRTQPGARTADFFVEHGVGHS